MNKDKTNLNKTKIKTYYYPTPPLIHSTKAILEDNLLLTLRGVAKRQQKLDKTIVLNVKLKTARYTKIR